MDSEVKVLLITCNMIKHSLLLNLLDQENIYYFYKDEFKNLYCQNQTADIIVRKKDYEKSLSLIQQYESAEIDEEEYNELIEKDKIDYDKNLNMNLSSPSQLLSHISIVVIAIIISIRIIPVRFSKGINIIENPFILFFILFALIIISASLFEISRLKEVYFLKGKLYCKSLVSKKEIELTSKKISKIEKVWNFIPLNRSFFFRNDTQIIITLKEKTAMGKTIKFSPIPESTLFDCEMSIYEIIDEYLTES